MVCDSAEELIGKTPLVRLHKIEKEYSLEANLYAKLEKFNPGGSAKDRVALQMINDAEKSGKIKEGATVIEPTSGNTGIGLAVICALRGYRMILVMPDTMSKERISIVRSLGAEVVLTPGKDGMKGSVDKAAELNDAIPNSFVASQFSNPSNSLAHYLSTGPEIYSDLDGKVDALVATVGTGGTVSGTGKYLKEKNPSVEVIGVEPSESPLITKGFSAPHGIQGIGANFIPEVYNPEFVDKVVTVSTGDAFRTAKTLAAKEALQCGISSGAALFAAIETAKRKNCAGKNIAVILPDGGDRYYSTELYSFDN